MEQIKSGKYSGLNREIPKKLAATRKEERGKALTKTSMENRI